MIKIMFACLFLAMGLWGCDDNGGGSMSECIVPSEDTNFLEDRFNDCPTDGLAEVCENNGYGCNLFREESDELPEIQGTFSPQGFVRGGQELSRPCEYIDCFTMECDFNNISVFPTEKETILFSDIFPSAEGFTGSAEVEGEGKFNFVVCNAIMF